MLTEIRDRSTGWFAGAIAALIIIPMAFWGIQDYTDTNSEAVLLSVGDQKITQQAFQQQLAAQQERVLQNNPTLANSGIFSSDAYKQQVLDGMINRALVSDLADEHSYIVGDQALAAYIKENELFQTDGKFDQVAYDTYVATRTASKTQFENQVRDNTRLFHVQAGYDQSAIVLPDEVRQLLEIQVEQRSFDMITVKQSDYSESIVVNEADINEYYNANIERFMEPQRVSINYVELGFDEIAKSVDVTDEEVRALYEQDIERYRSVETRDTRHILLSTETESESDQLAKAQSLINELNRGADFAELAKQHSQDGGSATAGGSLGVLDRGVMAAEFDKATFELEAGAISQPVKTRFGYHIIKVDEIIGGTVQPFEEVQENIKSSEQSRLAQDILIERAEQLKNLVFEQADSLDGIASELGLTIKSTELFSRNAQGAGVAQYDAVRAAAFSEQVLDQELNSDLIEISPSRYIALRKLNSRDTEPMLLANVSEQIKADLIDQRASDAAAKAGADILAKATTSWGELASDSSVEIESYTVSMLDSELKTSNEVLSEVFKTQLNGATQKVVSLTDNNGDFNIVRLNAITPGDVDKVSEQVKESTRRLVSQRNGGSLFQSYLNGLSEQFKEKVNEDLL